MPTLARPIGLGLAAGGDLDDAVDWSRWPADAGLTRSGSTTATSSGTPSPLDGRRRGDRGDDRDESFRVAPAR
jgi:hypothetical protein